MFCYRKMEGDFGTYLLHKTLKCVSGIQYRTVAAQLAEVLSQYNAACGIVNNVSGMEENL